MVDANLAGAIPEDATLNGASLEYANLYAANLTSSSIVGTDFTGAICPNGIVYGNMGEDCDRPTFSTNRFREVRRVPAVRSRS